MDIRKIALFLLLLAAACGEKPPAAPVAPGEPVTIFAASSLKEVVTEIAEKWSVESGLSHRLQFEATSTLARQIEEGAAVDVFLTASPEWLDKIKTLERFDWLSNRLVLVVPTEAKDPDLKALDSLALANEQVPVGKYAREALAHEGVKIPARTIYGQNVRDVLSKVSQGGAQAGVVYATDVAIDPGVRVASMFPPESHARILYAAGMLTPAGKAFLDTLRQPWAMEIAKKHGFADLE